MKNRARESRSDESLEAQIESDPSRRASGVQARAQRSMSASSATLAALRLERPLVSIGSPADPALLEPTYAYLSAYSATCFTPAVAQRLNVAIYELYANALRYGTAAGEVRLEIERTPNGEGAKLVVVNRAEPARIAELQAHLARVQADPNAAFMGEMNRFAGRSQPPPMLGIVRVAHESALALELQVDGDLVAISTICDG